MYNNVEVWNEGSTVIDQVETRVVNGVCVGVIYYGKYYTLKDYAVLAERDMDVLNARLVDCSRGIYRQAVQ